MFVEEDNLKRSISSAAVGAALLLVLAGPARAQEQGGQRHIFFLHHSTGRNLLAEGGVRELVEVVDDAMGVDLLLWDHDYNYEGLTDPTGVLHEEWNYGIPLDNTDPYGLHLLWTGTSIASVAARDSILSRHDVIAFKSCYTASEIPTDETLAQYKQWYLEIRDVLDRYPGKTFVIISPPPRHRLAPPDDLSLTERLAQADRARAFAEWLGSDEFLAGHSNLVFFDLFDRLAHPDDGTTLRNLLRAEYERDPDAGDSHPNRIANEQVGPLFVGALLEASRRPVPVTEAGWGDVKAMFR